MKTEPKFETYFVINSENQKVTSTTPKVKTADELFPRLAQEEEITQEKSLRLVQLQAILDSEKKFPYVSNLVSKVKKNSEMNT